MRLVAKDLWRFLGGIALAALLLWFVFRGTDFATVRDQLLRASFPLLVLSAVLQVGHNVFRVLRWRALLEPVRVGIPFRPMFVAVILGYMVSWLIPGRLGELARPALLSGREKLPLAPCLGSVLTDRVLDALCIACLLAVGLLLTPLQGEAARHATFLRGSALVLVPLATLPLVLLMLACRSRERLTGWLARRAALVRWLGTAVVSVSGGSEALLRPRLLGRITSYGLLAWMMIAAGLWVGVLGCGGRIPYTAMFIILPATALGVALPTPGGAGGYQVAMTWGLMEIAGVEESVAIGAGLLVWLASVVPIILLGWILLWTDRVPFRDLIESAKELRNLGAQGVAQPTVEESS